MVDPLATAIVTQKEATELLRLLTKMRQLLSLQRFLAGNRPESRPDLDAARRDDGDPEEERDAEWLDYLATDLRDEVWALIEHVERFDAVALALPSDPLDDVVDVAPLRERAQKQARGASR